MIKIKNFEKNDIDWLVGLNNSCVPAVNYQTAKMFLDDFDFYNTALVATKDSIALGAMILLREGTNYASKNYIWHCEKNKHHLYVDRIIIDQKARGLGIGRLLYEHAFTVAKQQSVPITAEVNTIPDNPQSHAFHLALGFDVVGEMQYKADYAVKYYKYES